MRFGLIVAAVSMMALSAPAMAQSNTNGTNDGAMNNGMSEGRAAAPEHPNGGGMGTGAGGGLNDSGMHNGAGGTGAGSGAGAGGGAGGTGGAAK
jgi:hypothetical protein